MEKATFKSTVVDFRKNISSRGVASPYLCSQHTQGTVYHTMHSHQLLDILHDIQTTFLRARRRGRVLETGFLSLENNNCCCCALKFDRKVCVLNSRTENPFCNMVKTKSGIEMSERNLVLSFHAGKQANLVANRQERKWIWSDFENGYERGLQL